MIFITTSNGVYLLDPKSAQARVVMTRKHTRGFFQKKSHGYFGITRLEQDGKIVVASRERLGTKVVDKPTTDCKLHSIDPHTLEHHVLGEVRDVHDVHQIASSGSLIFLTDTGKNRVHVYDLAQAKTVRIINIGSERIDIHHLNAVRVSGETLLIGMNNRGKIDSSILAIPLARISAAESFEIDGLQLGTLQQLTGIQHTHDLEPYGAEYLCCASHAGFVFRTSDLKPIITINNWVRGLCSNEQGIWVGTSPLASREKRHSEALDGTIHLYSHDDFHQLASYPLSGSGQVNDLLCYPG